MTHTLRIDGGVYARMHINWYYFLVVRYWVDRYKAFLLGNEMIGLCNELVGESGPTSLKGMAIRMWRGEVGRGGERWG